MPSINEVLERTDRARPSAVDEQTRAAWLLELDGQLLREVILRHKVTPGSGYRGPAAACPVCGAASALRYCCQLDANECQACGWSDLPKVPKQFPEDGDEPLLVGPPYDGLYDLYLFSKIDFLNREAANYNNSAQAYNAALDEWKKAYHRGHMPVSAGSYPVL